MTRASRWLGITILAAVFAIAMGRFFPRVLIIETDAEEPAPADAFPFSRRPNRAREIKWRAWSAEVFEEAKKAGKPVAISLTATWCQKCHEMDEGAFSDPEVIALLNAEFVCVRVDTDKHPDIKDRYLSPRGWPTTAFCASNGAVMTKTWFMPAAEYLAEAKKAAENWKANKEAILAKGATEPPARRDPSAAAIGEVDEVLAGMEKTWAEDGTGWAAGELRFPQPPNIELYLWKYGASRDKKWLERAVDGARATLKIEDSLEYGFYRVAMKADWSDPHYEKLLETNAGMLAALTALWRETGDEAWSKAAGRTVEWMQGTLAQAGGGWSASQDADPDYFKLDANARAKARKPHVDPAFYAGPNAQAASAFFAFAAGTGNGEARASAVKALERIFAELWTADGLRHGKDGALDLLRDLALVGEACLDHHQATGDAGAVTRAKDVAARILKLAEEDGGLLDRPTDKSAPGWLKLPLRKSQDNGRAAGFLVRLHHVTGEESFKKAAEAALKAVGGQAIKLAAWSGEYAQAVARLRTYPLHLVVVGPKELLPPMVRAADAFWHPWKTVTVLESKGEVVKQGDLEYPPELAAYACVAEACGPPVRIPSEFAREVGEFLERNR